MEIRKRIYVGAMLLICLLTIGTSGYWIISGGNFLDSLYMTVITAATVGYEETFDMKNNPGGRIFTIIFIIFSLITVAIITSMLAATILEAELTRFMRRRKMSKEITKLANHYIVCGAGTTGMHIIQEMKKMMVPFVVIDLDQAQIDKTCSLDESILYINGDATEDEILLSAGVEKAAGVIAALPSDKDNLYITVMTRQYNKKARIVALGVEDKALSKLKTAGADAVIAPAIIGGMRMASEMVRPSTVKFLDTMLRQTSSIYRIEEILVDSSSHLVGKKFGDITFRANFDLLVLAIMRLNTDEIIYNPPIDTIIKPDHIIVVMGEINNIVKAREFVSRKHG